MNEERVTNEKVIKFEQSESNTKIFRHDYPVSDELRKVMVNEVFTDYMKFAFERYYNEFFSLLREFAENHHLEGEKRDELVHNLFWWRLLYDSSSNLGLSCIEEYIAVHYHSLRKRPILISWLRECDKVVPKFYHVGYKFNDRVLVVTDFLTEKTLNVIVHDPLAIPPKKGEIVMGTLIPLGDNLFFPIIDFYHFSYEARRDIAMNLHHYFYKHLKTSPMHEAFIHVLSAMLQIERFITIENQENASLN